MADPRTETRAGYRRALGAIASVGASSVVNTVAGIAKMKIAAVILGPAGLGTVSLLQQFIGTVSTVTSLGVGTSGTREVAAALAAEDAKRLVATRRALTWGTLAVALVGASLIIGARRPLALLVMDDPLRSSELAWMSIGVALTVMAGSHRALVNGYRRIKDLALINALTGIVSAIIAAVSLLLWREGAVVLFVLVSPLTSFLLAAGFASRLPKATHTAVSPKCAATVWWRMAQLGVAFMLSAGALSVGHLVVKTLIQREIGPDGLGLFSAAWLLSQYSTSFLFAAITADFYPRISAEPVHESGFQTIVNEQTEMLLLVSAPILLAIMAVAPIALTVLYSAEFVGASRVLRWLVLGDVLKTAAHPLGFALLAASAGRSYLLARVVAVSTYAGTGLLLIGSIGLPGGAIAYLGMYCVYLAILLLLAARLLSVRWTRGICFTLLALLASGVCIALAAQVSETWSLVIGTCLTLAWAGGATAILYGRTKSRSS